MYIWPAVGSLSSVLLPPNLQRAAQPWALALLYEAGEPTGQPSKPIGTWVGNSQSPAFRSRLILV